MEVAVAALYNLCNYSINNPPVDKNE